MKPKALMVGLLLAAGMAHAQQNNNQYFQEQQRIQQQQHAAEQARQGYMQSPGQQQAASQQPAGEWKTMWGSIATDGPKGILGAAANMGSESLAETTALDECRKKGGNPCKVETTYSNQCSALVTGDKIFIVRLGTSEQEAANLGMQKCSAEDVNCRVYFSSCSRPQFVRY